MTTAKKEHILNIAADLFFKHGIKSITMDEIAREAAVSKKTIYSYYKDKKELIEAFTDRAIASPVFNLSVSPNTNAIDQLFKYRKKVADIFKLVQNHLDYDLKRLYPGTHRKLENFKRKFIYELEMTLLEKGKKEGLFRPELDNDFIARIAIGRSLLVFNPENALFTEKECLSMATFDKIIDFHLHAICTPYGIEYYKQQLNKTQNEN
jgi:AcrR family transcriptional regulator